MPTQIKLTWFEPRKCWKKFFKGKVFYLGKGSCSGKSDPQGYQIAWREWQATQQELAASAMRQRSGHLVPSPFDPAFSHYAKIGVTSPVVIESSPTESGLRVLAERFLKMRREESDAKEISVMMYGQYKYTLDDFVEYLKVQGRNTVDGIDEAILDAYRSDLQKLIRSDDENGISPHTATKRLQTAKQFVKWLYARRYLSFLPRNLEEACSAFAYGPLAPQFFTPDEVRKIFNAATRRTQLYIALALNAGYTQIDIATLEHSHVDFEKGEIRRCRNKTGVPQVHKLWAATHELLLMERTSPSDGGLMLLDAKGQPLYRETIRENGNTSKNDVIKLAFDRAMKAAGFDQCGDETTPKKREKRRFKTFRKTAANEIEKMFPDAPHISSQFLAHRETATKRFYVARHFDQLFKALDELEMVYRLNPEV